MAEHDTRPTRREAPDAPARSPLRTVVVHGSDISVARAHSENDSDDVLLSEERLRVDKETEPAGAARAVKRVEVDHVETRVSRGSEHADTERVEVPDAEADSGQVETLEDGSLSIPVFEEQIVVTERLVVRERVVVRKHTVYEDHVVSADLRRERLEIDADDGVIVHHEGEGAA